jgi:hypothetical protein
MTPSRHSLRQVVFELKTDSAARGRRVQERVGGFCKSRLESVLDAGFAEFDAEGSVYVFERIELDLGPITESDLETEIEERLRRALRDFLMRHLPPTAPRDVGPERRATPAEAPERAAGEVPPTRRRLEWLAEFLDRGVLSWAAEPGTGPDGLLAGLIGEAPAELLELIENLGQREPARKRLAHGISEPVLTRLVGLLEPDQQGLIVAYVHDVTTVHQRRPMVREDHRTFRGHLWEFVLAFLLLDRGSRFNARSFVKTTLRRMAARYRLSYRALLLGLIARVETLRPTPSQGYSLPAILLSLSDEEHTGLVPSPRPDSPPPVPASGAADIPDPTAGGTAAELLERFLVHGTPPAALKHRGGREPAAWLAGLADADIVAALTRLEPGESVLRRLVRELPEPFFARVAGLLAEPAAAPSVPDLLGALDRLAPLAGNPADFRWRVREYLLACLWHRDSPPPAGEWVRRVLWAVAVRYGLGYRRLLRELAARARGGPLESIARQLTARTPDVRYETAGRPVDSGNFPADVEPVSTGPGAGVGTASAGSGAAGAHGAPYIPPSIERLILFLETGRPADSWRAYAGRGEERTAPLASDAVPFVHRSLQSSVSAPESSGDTPRHWLEEALAQDPERLIERLKAGGDRPEFVRRLLDYLPPAALSRLVETLSPGHGGLILSLLLAGAGLERDAALGPRQRRRAGYIHWEVALGILLDAHAPAFETRRFVAEAGHRTAQRLGLPLAAYAGGLSRSARAGARSQPRFHPLLDILESLHGRRPDAERDDASPFDLASPLLPEEGRSEGAQTPGPAPSLPSGENRGEGIRTPGLAPPLPLGEGRGEGIQNKEPVPPAPYSEFELPDGTLPSAEPENPVEALRYFLQYGEWPETLPKPAWDRLVSELEGRSGEFRPLLLWAAGRPPERRRLAGVLPPEVFRAVVKLLLPTDADAALLSLAALEEAATSLPGSSADLWQRAGAEALLAGAHRGRGGSLDYVDYLAATLRRLAPDPAEAENLLDAWHTALKRRSGTRAAGLLAVLDGLARELAREADLALDGEFPEGSDEPAGEDFPASGVPDAAEPVGPASAGPGGLQPALPGWDSPLEWLREALGSGGEPKPVVPAGSAGTQAREGGYPSAVSPESGDRARRAQEAFPRGAWERAGEEGIDWLERLSRDLAERPADYRRLFLAAAGREPARERLARSFPPALFGRVVNLLAPADAAAAGVALSALREVATAWPGQDPELWWRIGAAELLREAHRQAGGRLDWAAWLRAVRARLSAEARVEAAALLERWRGAVSRRPVSAREPLLRALNRVEREGPAKAARPAPRTAWPYRARDAEPDELPREEPFYVDNAGLVLLWPFLGRYFQMLGLLERHAFRDAAAQSRAVHLVQYLGTGELDAPEHRLLLDKLLCGFPTGLPPEPQPPITDAEAQLSEQLLYGVTQNWDKLRNTSIAGLREAFLQREGRLLRKDDAWSLAVSAKPYDLLLDSLPWSLSTIKLGWMPQPLYVQWR